MKSYSKIHSIRPPISTIFISITNSVMPKTSLFWEETDFIAEQIVMRKSIGSW